MKQDMFYDNYTQQINKCKQINKNNFLMIFINVKRSFDVIFKKINFTFQNFFALSGQPHYFQCKMSLETFI